MDKNSELECYLYYMWNLWSLDECKRIFADTCFSHIWAKWMQYTERCGCTGAPASFYASLDDEKRDTLRKYAVKHYNK